jgi:DNA-binding LytR/AlgR family response regulator
MKVKYITINVDRNSIRKIFINDILYLRAEGAYTKIKLFNSDTFLVSRLLKTFNFLTDKFNFYRAGRSYIINLDYILEITKGKPNFVKLINDENLPIHAKDFTYLKKYIISFAETPTLTNSDRGFDKTSDELVKNIANN